MRFILGVGAGLGLAVGGILWLALVEPDLEARSACRAARRLDAEEQAALAEAARHRLSYWSSRDAMRVARP